MTTRTIAQIETATNESVGSFKIKNVLPTRNLKQVDPFLLIHHMQPRSMKPGEDGRIPPHPHAGFEVMTYLIEGEFFHRDSKGHECVAKAGDVNWMSSGSGIVHSEGPTPAMLETGEKLQLMQVWINLPAKDKFVNASFQNHPSAGFPVIANEDSRVKVLLGAYSGKKSPVITQTPMFYFHVNLKAGTLLTLPVDSAYTSALYNMQGNLNVLNQEVKTGQLVEFKVDGDQLVFSAMEDSELVVFGGLPIKEKTVSYGPFVMNSFEEIQHVIGDYETGKMGQLEY